MKQLRNLLTLTLALCMVLGTAAPSFAVSNEISIEEDFGIPVEEDRGIEIEVDAGEKREELSVLTKEEEVSDDAGDEGDDPYVDIEDTLGTNITMEVGDTVTRVFDGEVKMTKDPDLYIATATTEYTTETNDVTVYNKLVTTLSSGSQVYIWDEENNKYLNNNAKWVDSPTKAIKWTVTKYSGDDNYTLYWDTSSYTKYYLRFVSVTGWTTV